MLETYSSEELRSLVGHEVVDTEGKSVGYVDLVFLDDQTGTPEWIGVWNGVWETKPRVLVPLRGAELVEDEIRIPHPIDLIRDGPTYEDEDDRGLFTDDTDAIGISAEKERRLYQYYGIQPLTPRPEGAPEDIARFRAWTTETRAPDAVRTR
jgi:sporulation protein YlmC with PRC-barrel domain